LLAQAGVRCCGAPRDEMLVDQVRRLYEDSNRTVWKSTARYQRGGVGVERCNVETLEIANRGSGSTGSAHEDGWGWGPWTQKLPSKRRPAPHRTSTLDNIFEGNLSSILSKQSESSVLRLQISCKTISHS
jgi:hypothetical protein